MCHEPWRGARDLCDITMGLPQRALKDSRVYTVNTQGEKCTAAAVNHTAAWENNIRGHQFARCIYLTHTVGGRRNRISLFVFFFPLLLLLRRSAGCEAPLTSEASAPPPATPAARAPLGRSLSNSRPFVGRLFCTSTLAFLFFVVFFNIIFVPCCRFTILLRSGSDTQLVNEHRRNRLNKEVGRLPCVETAEQWPPLCELSFFFPLLLLGLKHNVTIDIVPIRTMWLTFLFLCCLSVSVLDTHPEWLMTMFAGSLFFFFFWPTAVCIISKNNE